MKEKIVYVHGLNCSSKIFNYISSQLPYHDAEFIEYPSCGALDYSLSVAISNIESDEPFWVIGHSLGGLIGYLMALRGKGFVNVKGLVSISTPFGGSATASTLRWFYNMPILNDISPKSTIISEVTTQKISQPFLSIISTAGNLPFISGENDGVVSISSQRATLATDVIDVYASHFEVVQDPSTVQIIKDFIFQ